MGKDNPIPENFENRLDEFAPLLSSVSKENPFKTPVDYFETLPEKIASQIKIPKKENTIADKVKIIFNPRFYIPIAISIIIIVLITSKSPQLKTGNEQLAYAENSIEYQYLNSLIDNGELDESLLMETASGIDDTSKSGKATSTIENNIPMMNTSTVILSDSINKISITDDDIIQYLLDNDDNDDLIDY